MSIVKKIKIKRPKNWLQEERPRLQSTYRKMKKRRKVADKSN